MPTPSGLPRISRSPGRAPALRLRCFGSTSPIDDEPVDGLHRVDRVAAGNRDSRGRAHRFAAGEDPADRVDRQLVDRHAHQRQREERRAAHRVDVGDRVGRGDRAEVVRIVDDRHEEVGRRDDRLPLVQLIHGRVVGGLDPDQQRLRDGRTAGLGDDLLQHRGRDLAAAAAAVAELREAERGTFGCVHRSPGFVAAGSGPPQFPATAGARQPAFYRCGTPTDAIPLTRNARGPSRQRRGRSDSDPSPFRDMVLHGGEGGKG